MAPNDRSGPLEQLGQWLTKKVTPQVGMAQINSTIEDSFGRLRVSNPVSLWDSQLQYDEREIFWEPWTTGSASYAHLTDQSAVRLTITGSSSHVIRQSPYLRYQPGKSLKFALTMVMGSGTAGFEERAGLYDFDDGIYFAVKDGVPRFVVRSTIDGVFQENVVEQSEWNEDTLDGSGNYRNQSGVLFHYDKMQILVCDLQWLGGGSIRCGFFIDHKLIATHQFDHANIIDHVYTRSANLPLRVEIIGSDTLPDGSFSMLQVCSEVVSEGGFETERGEPVSVSNENNLISVTGRQPILSVRPKLEYKGQTNRALFDFSEASVFSEDQTLFCELIYGGVLSGTATWLDADGVLSGTYSAMEYSVSASGIIGGARLRSWYVAAADPPGNTFIPGSGGLAIESKLPFGLDMFGQHKTTPFTDVMSLVVTSVPGAASDVGGVLGWKELK